MVTLPLDCVAQNWNGVIATLEWGAQPILFSFLPLTVANTKLFLESLKKHVVEI